MNSGRQPAFNWRKAFYRFHGWLGINVGLLLFVVCFSGSVATLSNEIDWLVDPRARAQAQDEPYAWGAMQGALREAFPDGQITGISAPIGPGFASQAQVTVDDGRIRRVYLDPYTGDVKGVTHAFSAQQFFRSFHRWFYDEPRGLVVVTLSAFPLLLSGLTGFLFYKGWLKHLLSLRLNRGRRRFWSELHKTSSIWALLFTVLIALTGIFYLIEFGFQRTGRDALLLSPVLPVVDQGRLVEVGPQPGLLPVDRYLDAARAAAPDLDVRYIRMPVNAAQPFYLEGRTGTLVSTLTRDRADRIHIDPFSGDVLGVRASSELGFVPFVSEAADPLHFGYFGGLWSKILWAVLGLLLSFSILTGTYLWIVRSERSRKASGSVLQRGATVAVALTLAYFLYVVVITTVDIKGTAAPELDPFTLERVAVGPYELALDCHAPCSPESRTLYAARVSGDGIPNYRSIRLVAGSDTTTMSGPSYRPRARLPAGSGWPTAIEVTLRDGAVRSAALSGVHSGLDVAAPPVPDWPETAPGVWKVVVAFAGLTLAIVIGWLGLVLRGLRRGLLPRPPG